MKWQDLIENQSRHSGETDRRRYRASQWSSAFLVCRRLDGTGSGKYPQTDSHGPANPVFAFSAACLHESNTLLKPAAAEAVGQ